MACFGRLQKKYNIWITTGINFNMYSRKHEEDKLILMMAMFVMTNDD